MVLITPIEDTPDWYSQSDGSSPEAGEAVGYDQEQPIYSIYQGQDKSYQTWEQVNDPPTHPVSPIASSSSRPYIYPNRYRSNDSDTTSPSTSFSPTAWATMEDGGQQYGHIHSFNHQYQEPPNPGGYSQYGAGGQPTYPTHDEPHGGPIPGSSQQHLQYPSEYQLYGNTFNTASHLTNLNLSSPNTASEQYSTFYEETQVNNTPGGGPSTSTTIRRTNVMSKQSNIPNAYWPSTNTAGSYVDYSNLPSMALGYGSFQNPASDYSHLAQNPQAQTMYSQSNASFESAGIPGHRIVRRRRVYQVVEEFDEYVPEYGSQASTSQASSDVVVYRPPAAGSAPGSTTDFYGYQY